MGKGMITLLRYVGGISFLDFSDIVSTSIKQLNNRGLATIREKI